LFFLLGIAILLTILNWDIRKSYRYGCHHWNVAFPELEKAIVDSFIMFEVKIIFKGEA